MAAAGLAALIFLASRGSRQDDPRAGVPTAPTPDSRQAAEPLKDPTAPRPAAPESGTPAAAAPDPAPSPEKFGRLVGKLALPASVDRYSYRIYVFHPTGTETNEAYEGVDRFEIDRLTPGRKAVVLISPKGELGTTSGMVTIFEGRETEIQLAPPMPSFVEGQVLDSSGKELSALLVTWTEPLPLQELYGANPPRNAVRSGSMGGSTKKPGERNPPSRYFLLDPVGGTLTRGVPTDEHGRFRLSLTSNQSSVRVRVMLDLDKVLHEVSILPSAGPIRVVVPVAAVDQKK